MAQKKIFYALRPAAALRWLWMHPGEAIAPMHSPTLMEECDPPAELKREVDNLMARKALTRELGTCALVTGRPQTFIDHEFAESAAEAWEAGRAENNRGREGAGGRFLQTGCRTPRRDALAPGGEVGIDSGVRIR